jgi:hypothetical protein
VRIVEQLLDEGADINSRSKKYGTALNIAAARKDKDMTRMLLDRNARARLGGKEYSVLHMKRSELEAMLEELREVWRVSEQGQWRFWDKEIANLRPPECCNDGRGNREIQLDFGGR